MACFMFLLVLLPSRKPLARRLGKQFADRCRTSAVGYINLVSKP